MCAPTSIGHCTSADHALLALGLRATEEYVGQADIVQSDVVTLDWDALDQLLLQAEADRQRGR